jgi:hypothetical protein
MNLTDHEWMTGPAAWVHFVQQHPELGYKPGRMNFHNFLRFHRSRLVEADAIRMAKHKFWIAHRQRFCDAAFECATETLPIIHR